MDVVDTTREWRERGFYPVLSRGGEPLDGEDTLSVYPTAIGGDPNLLMEIDLAPAGAFVDELASVRSLQDWNAFRDRYAVLRNSERFWAVYDWMNDWNFSHRGDEAGAFDLSDYDLYDSVY